MRISFARTWPRKPPPPVITTFILFICLFGLQLDTEPIVYNSIVLIGFAVQYRALSSSYLASAFLSFFMRVCCVAGCEVCEV